MDGEFEKVFKWWIDHKEYVTYGLSLYQQFVYSIELTSVQKFLNIVFALETLHATFFDKKNFTDEEMAHLMPVVNCEGSVENP